MEGMELLCFEIISSVGAARSCYVEAMRAARIRDFGRAEELMQEGMKHFRAGHEKHAELVQQEAAGKKTEISLILIHSEDQMMSAEVLEIVATELIELYKNK